MAYTTINKSTDYFNTKLYTGNSSTQSITGINFQPDMTWIKARSGTHGTENHNLFDVVRGATKYLIPNGTTASTTDTNSLTAFDSDGFSLGTRTDVNGSAEYASWNWLANGTGSANTDGSISSTVSANTTSGFSIVSYTGNGSAGATIGHGLGSIPAVIIIRRLNVVASWRIFHQAIGNTKNLVLNTGAGEETSSTMWNNTSPTSTTFSLGSYDEVNGSSAPHIAYCFAEKPGYSKMGSYTGNGNADGPMVYTGFKPAFVIIKKYNTSENWLILDTKRGSYNFVDEFLQPNQSGAEANHNIAGGIDILSNGMKMRHGDGTINASGGSYIYMAFGQSIVGSNNVPATAR